MKNNYTVIRPEMGEFLDSNVWEVIKANKVLSPLVARKKLSAAYDPHGNVVAIDVPTDALKTAIKTDADMRVALREFDTLLADIATPNFIISGIFRGAKVALPIPGKVYVKATERGENTTIFPHQKEGESQAADRIKRIARFIPAGLVLGGITGTAYIGYKVTRAGIDVVTPAAERNRRAVENDKGLDEVVREMSGEKPKDKPQDNSDTNTMHQNKQNSRNANPAQQQGRH
jgi:hypothetical protein